MRTGCTSAKSELSALGFLRPYGNKRPRSSGTILIKLIEDMTAVGKKLLETPMAPYSRLLQGMSREDKKIVIMFLTESLAESVEEAKDFKLSKEERKRGLMSLAGCWKDDPEDAAKMEAAIKDGRKNEFMREINLDD